MMLGDGWYDTALKLGDDHRGRLTRVRMAHQHTRGAALSTSPFHTLH